LADAPFRELEVRAATTTVAGMEFAVWRNGLSLGYDTAQVCYHSC
jgi:hypothetical protein